MTEIRINPEQVSHVRVFDQIKGVQGNLGNILQYKFLPSTYRKYLFGLIIWGDKEAYYKNGVYDSWFMIDKLLEGYVDVNGWMEEKPHIEVFAGKELIKRMYFNSLEDAKKWLKENLPKVNLIIKE